MRNNFVEWSIRYNKERLKSKVIVAHASNKRAVMDDACVADTLRASKLALHLKPGAEPLATLRLKPLIQNFLTDEQVMRYLVTEKIK